MPTASSRDPHRVFDLAVKSTRLLGILSVGFGLVIMITYGYFNPLHRFQIPFELFGGVVWLLPGVGFLAAAILMKQRRRWPVIAALWTAAFQLLAALALLICSCVFSPVSVIPIVMCAVWVAALAQLLLYLWQSLNTLNLIEGTSQRGFDPIMIPPAQVLPQDAQSNVSVRGK